MRGSGSALSLTPPIFDARRSPLTAGAHPSLAGLLEELELGGVVICIVLERRETNGGSPGVGELADQRRWAVVGGSQLSDSPKNRAKLLIRARSRSVTVTASS